ncbi:MAG: ribosome maturation factor RimM [Acidobacteriota bacterium]|nr:ribosome maturation factor RimM [Blastocatellia bacterium]MDW8412664.1 ribosome maturation factor RimM [Acidobacteriota bacterium]
MSPDDLVSIARIVRPHGTKGEVIAELETDFPERFSNVKSVYLCSTTSSSQVTKTLLESFWFHKGRVILKFAGYNNRSSAETLRSYRVKIPKEELVNLPEDTYYEFELIGCKVLKEDKSYIGEVIALMPTGSVPNLVVKGSDREYLIPFASAICIEVDISAKLIVISPPEGLLSL